ncbi:hypothetical protein F2Q69_00044231 [Brassica cretica]|uniref:DUF4283 domain-containing protein n=1 Tax=Brassica cretica TaxID=69181 RepID=A0A8S9N9Y0_BRACR|nr:hypothetical protein F2Q69_00044231 [Brassica cretica]
MDPFSYKQCKCEFWRSFLGRGSADRPKGVVPLFIPEDENFKTSATSLHEETLELNVGTMAAITLASEGDCGDASDGEATAALSIQALEVNGAATEPAAVETMKQGNAATFDGKHQSDGSPRSAPWTKKKMGGGDPEAIVDVVDGVASLQIPEEIFDEAELLWKSYVVGYFIGDAPHVGSIHATVNRIYQMRSRVIQRKYWHIADIPLVVNVWTPESALHPPDLSAMPLWVDLKGVPNNLYSHKGLKFLSRAVGQFVKLHPSTEKCVRLDVARALVEVNLHQPLVEKISFKDNAGSAHEVEVNFPWLPPRCSVCRRWGHKGQDCSSKEIRILNKKVEEAAASLFAVIPHGRDKAGDRVEVVEGNEVATVEGDVIKEGNVFENLIQDLEALTPVANNVAALEGIKLTEPTTEVFHTNGIGAWENGRGMKQVGDTGGEGAIIISPSRFSPLQGIEEEAEDAMEDNGKEVEEGEILENNVDGKKVPGVHVSKRGRKPGSAQKQMRGKIVRTKDLIYAVETRVQESNHQWCMSAAMPGNHVCNPGAKYWRAISGVTNDARKPFRFFNFLAEHKDLLPTVQRVWDLTQALYPSRTALSFFHRKLKLLKQPLRELRAEQDTLWKLASPH